MENVTSLNILRSGRRFLFERGFVGSLPLMNRFAIRSRKAKTRPNALVAQAKPPDVNSDDSMRG